jgi:uncharacterized membrane protein YGL010W
MRMKSLTEQLSTYATYHRDRRNIATHFFGIPMIVLSIGVLLSRPALLLDSPFPVTPALVVMLGAAIFYFMLDVRYGIAMIVLLGLTVWAGAWFASQSTIVWLASGLGLFVVGWVFQLVGHVFEGKKPAFVDDLAGLLLGPLFVVAEAGFALGLRGELKQAIKAPR